MASPTATAVAAPAPEGRTIFTRQQAAEFFSVSARTLDQWAADGKITPVRFGHSVRYHRDELERVAREGIPA
jgi:excisionase family DNA binding protein